MKIVTLALALGVVFNSLYCLRDALSLTPCYRVIPFELFLYMYVHVSVSVCVGKFL